MNVPLSVGNVVKHGKEILNIWYNKKQKFLDSPTYPYFYTKDKFDIHEAIKTTQITKVALSNFQEKLFYKVEFRNRNDLVAARDRLEDEYGRNVVFEAHIPYLLRLRIDSPELFTKFPHTDELTFHFLDIEQYIQPNKLRPLSVDRITAISWCNDIKKRTIQSIFLKKETLTDKELLRLYFKNSKIRESDVICLYNKSYDMPMILLRSMNNRIDTSCISKANIKPTLGGREGVGIEGSIIYDIYDSAEGDQSLTGNIPDKGLKAVSDYFDFKNNAKVLTREEMVNLIGTKELVEYNKDDVRRLLCLFDVYFDTIEYKANELKIPLNYATGLSMTDLGIIVLGDLYREHNIIADGDNWTRYPQIFQRKKSVGEPNFQGALVDIKRTGVFQKVKKADYGSMYPKIAMEFNLGPDTTTLLEFQPYGKFEIKEENQWFVYSIPDDVLKKNIIIQVSKRQGFMAKKINIFLTKRAYHKKQHKETGSKQERAKSDIYKVFANGSVGYGIHGAPHHPFGFAPMAISTTGLGRECAKLLIDVLEELYPSSVVEVDTDGVYFVAENFDEKKVLELFNKKLEEKFKKKLDLTIDIEEFDRGYFYKMKNYVLEKKGKLILHGGALKSSRKDNISERLINDIAWAKLEKRDEKSIIDKYRKLDFPLEDFAMKVQMGMNPNEYKNQNGFVMSLAKQAKKYFDIDPRIGNEYYYIKAKSGYKLLELATMEEIDRDYYLEEINRNISIFNIEQPIVSIDKWI